MNNKSNQILNRFITFKCHKPTESSFNNLSQFGFNHWICFVIFFHHSAHPHFQQTRIDVNYKLDKYGNENAKRGYIEIRKGERSFWKALDNSNDPKNIEKVQRAIHDETPNDFRLRETKIEFKLDSKGNVVDVDPKTRSV